MPETNASLQHLGRMLRSIRASRKLTGAELGMRSNLSQSAISKLETGHAGIPTWNRIMLILRALDATAEETDQMRHQYEISQLDPTSYAFMRRTGLSQKQTQLRDLEHSSRLIRDFQNSVVPGLLQTPSYAYNVFRLLGLDDSSARTAASQRAGRQVILNDPARKFVFVLLDAALYSRHGATREEHWRQLDLIAARASAFNVSVRVLDSRRGLPISIANPFVIMDRRFVSAETTVRELTATTPTEVQEYEAAFAELLDAALDPMESLSLIRSVMGSLVART